MRWPFNGRNYVTRGFEFQSGLYVGGKHAALDIVPLDEPTYGAPVHAVADGTLYAYPQNDYYGGWNVYIDHADGWRSGYRHFRELIWAPGASAQVKKGQIIGYADSTGTVTGPHLHFDLWNKTKRSPEAFFKMGWWAHDPTKWLGAADDTEEFLMALSDVEQRHLQAQVNDIYAKQYDNWARIVQILMSGAKVGSRIWCMKNDGTPTVWAVEIEAVTGKIYKRSVNDPATFGVLGGTWLGMNYWAPAIIDSIKDRPALKL